MAQMTAAAQAAAEAAQAAVQISHHPEEQQGQPAPVARKSAHGPGIDGRFTEKPKRFLYHDVDAEDGEFPHLEIMVTSELGLQDPVCREELGELEMRTTAVDGRRPLREGQRPAFPQGAQCGVGAAVCAEGGDAAAPLRVMATTAYEHLRSVILGYLQALTMLDVNFDR